jgi:hypothetical protein
VRRLRLKLPRPSGKESRLDRANSETVFDGLRSGPRLWELKQWVGWNVRSRAGQSKNFKDTIAGKSEPNDPPTVQAPNSVLIDPSEPKVIGSSCGLGPTNAPALLTVPMVGDGKVVGATRVPACTETVP